MKRIFTLWLLSLLPFAATAQFPGRIYNLQAPKMDKVMKTVELSIDKTLRTGNYIVLDTTALKTLLRQQSSSLSAGDSFRSFVNNAGDQFQTGRAHLKEELVKDIKESSYTMSTSDSMITEYRKLVGAGITDTISPAMAYWYRNIIDKAIRQNRATEEEHYKLLQKSVLSLPALKPEEIQKDPCKEYILNNIHSSQRRRLIAQARNYFHYLYLSEDNQVRKPWFIPLRSITHAEFFYFGENGERLKLLTNFSIQSNFTNNATVTTEIVSGILPFEAWGHKNPRRRFSLPLKFDLGTTLAQNSDTSTEAKTADKLLYGGLLHARLSYPLYYSNWKYYNGKGIQLYLPLTTTINWENVKDGSNLLSDMYYFGEIAVNLNAEIDIIQGIDTKSNASLFINGKFAYIDGSSKFHESLSAGRSGLWLFQMNGGIRASERFTIAANVPVWCSKPQLLNNKSASLAILIDPNF